MEGSASTPPSSSTAASASAPEAPASLDQLDQGQVSGPVGSGGCGAGWPQARGAGAGSSPPRTAPELREEGPWVARPLPARPSRPRGDARRRQPCGLAPQVEGSRYSLRFRGGFHPALLPYPLTLGGRVILQASVTWGLKRKGVSAGVGFPESEDARPVKRGSQGPGPERSAHASCVSRVSWGCRLHRPVPGKPGPGWRDRRLNVEEAVFCRRVLSGSLGAFR